MSWREIETKFTRSELAVMAWRSQEVSAQLDKPTKKPKGQRDVVRELDEDERAERPETENMTQDEALKYFAERGISFPMMFLK